MKETAYFVKHPRILDDLKAPHFAEAEEPYEIVKEVTLAKIDYENFVTDMLADRAFLEDFDADGSTLKKCILVKQRGNQTEAVLTVPTAAGHVQYAAYITSE